MSRSKAYRFAAGVCRKKLYKSKKNWVISGTTALMFVGLLQLGGAGTVHADVTSATAKSVVAPSSSSESSSVAQQSGTQASSTSTQSTQGSSAVSVTTTTSSSDHDSLSASNPATSGSHANQSSVSADAVTNRIGATAELGSNGGDNNSAIANNNATDGNTPASSSPITPSSAIDSAVKLVASTGMQQLYNNNYELENDEIQNGAPTYSLQPATNVGSMNLTLNATLANSNGNNPQLEIDTNPGNLSAPESYFESYTGNYKLALVMNNDANGQPAYTRLNNLTVDLNDGNGPTDIDPSGVQVTTVPAADRNTLPVIPNDTNGQADHSYTVYNVDLNSDLINNSLSNAFAANSKVTVGLDFDSNPDFDGAPSGRMLVEASMYKPMPVKIQLRDSYGNPLTDANGNVIPDQYVEPSKAGAQPGSPYSVSVPSISGYSYYNSTIINGASGEISPIVINGSNGVTVSGIFGILDSQNLNAQDVLTLIYNKVSSVETRTTTDTYDYVDAEQPLHQIANPITVVTTSQRRVVRNPDGSILGYQPVDSPNAAVTTDGDSVWGNPVSITENGSAVTDVPTVSDPDLTDQGYVNPTSTVNPTGQNTDNVQNEYTIAYQHAKKVIDTADHPQVGQLVSSAATAGAHISADVVANIAPEMVTRTVNFVDQNNQPVAASVSQTAHFNRSVIVDVVSGKILGYTVDGNANDSVSADAAWQSSDNVKSAISVPDLTAQGYSNPTIDQQPVIQNQVPATTLTADQKNETINVVYQANQTLVKASTQPQAGALVNPNAASGGKIIAGQTTAADLNKTITQVVTFVDASGHPIAGTTPNVQTVHYSRDAIVNSVTGAVIKYVAPAGLTTNDPDGWATSNDQFAQVAPLHLSVQGYQTTSTPVAGWTVNVNSSGQNVQIVYQHQLVVIKGTDQVKSGQLVEAAASAGATITSAVAADLAAKPVTRTIHYLDTRGNEVAPSVTQTESLTRDAVVDAVTGSLVGYTTDDQPTDLVAADAAWQAHNASFAAITAPDLTAQGYAQPQPPVVTAQSVPTNADQMVVNVFYPDAQKLVPGNAQPQVGQSIDPNAPKASMWTAADQSALSKTVTRTIDYQNERGQTVAPQVTQTVTFTRDAVFNLVTGQISYYTVDGQHSVLADQAWATPQQQLAAVATPNLTAQGYALAQSVASVTVTPAAADTKVVVTYADGQRTNPVDRKTVTVTINYLDADTGQPIQAAQVATATYHREQLIDQVTGAVLGYTLDGKNVVPADQAWVVDTVQVPTTISAPDLTASGYQDPQWSTEPATVDQQLATLATPAGATLNDQTVTVTYNRPAVSHTASLPAPVRVPVSSATSAGSPTTTAGSTTATSANATSSTASATTDKASNSSATSSAAFQSANGNRLVTRLDGGNNLVVNTPINSSQITSNQSSATDDTSITSADSSAATASSSTTDSTATSKATNSISSSTVMISDSADQSTSTTTTQGRTSTAVTGGETSGTTPQQTVTTTQQKQAQGNQNGVITRTKQTTKQQPAAQQALKRLPQTGETDQSLLEVVIGAFLTLMGGLLLLGVRKPHNDH